MYPLTPQEEAAFYANVLAVASAEGKIDSNSQVLLEDLQKRLKLKKSVVRLAEKTVFASDWKPLPVGTFAHQVDNIETMVAVAMADEDLTDREQRMIATFANAIGINQLQMDAIVSGVKERRLGIPADGSGKLETLVKFDIPNTGVALEFAESTSDRFPDILAAWEAAPMRQKCVKDGKTWYLAAWPNGTLEDLIPLALLLAPLTHKQVRIAGKVSSWWRTLGFARCAEKREKAFNPEAYCFGLDGEWQDPNPWGCREMGLSWSHWERWGQFGRWKQQGERWLWHFDKKQLGHEINEGYRLVANCPHRIKGLPEAVLDILPEMVDPITDPDWTYQAVSPETPGSLNVTDGTSNTCIFGVAPKHGEVYRTILDKAFAKLNAGQAGKK